MLLLFEEQKRALAEGRNQRKLSECARNQLRLRLRHAAYKGKARRARLPYGKQKLLLQKIRYKLSESFYKNINFRAENKAQNAYSMKKG